ncbi:MAG: TIGR03759 family integrating conjugative element protein [Gammaproteobacteria bacterium]|nr:TIGR03759 family integrating conjugative element protein [Gammaproteobacteria bacterium]
MTAALRGGAGTAALALALSVWTAHGADVADSAVRESGVRAAERRAAVWDLSRGDWTRYEALMAGRRGAWSPDADPLLVLGAHARSESERRRFAEAFVLAEHARVEGELAFERAVQTAWRRLFPGRPRIAGPAGAVSPAQIDRYALVADRDCADCGRRVRARLESGVPVDVYVRGAADDADLRAWAAGQALDPGAVRAGRVTLNHGDGAPPVAAPAVWARTAGGGWAPVEALP